MKIMRTENPDIIEIRLHNSQLPIALSYKLTESHLLWMLQVLDHYTTAGLLEVTELTLPGHQPNLPGLQHLYMEARRRTPELLQFELISLHDCLYRNMYR